jgi:hypothetical protein
MTPTFTAKETSRSAINDDGYSTGSVSFDAGSIAIVDVSSVVGSGTANEPTLSGLSLTWTSVASQLLSTNARRITRFRALVGGAASGVITIDFAAQLQQNCDWSITQITDCVTTGTNGEDAIQQTKTSAPVGTASSCSITFDATWDHADNRALGVFHHNSDTRPFTAGTNFTILGQAQGSSASSGIATEHGRDSDDAVDIDAGGGALAWMGIISEIVGAADEAPPAAALQPFIRRRGFNFGMR